MNRLRLVTNNAADRATISVAGTAAGMGADNLKTDIKGEVCRVLGTSCTITLDWASLEVARVVFQRSMHNCRVSDRLRRCVFRELYYGQYKASSALCAAYKQITR